MKIPFACPSCGASGSVDESLVGRHVRCNQCTHRFAVPGPGEAVDDGYALAEPPRVAAGFEATGQGPGPVFVAARGGSPPIFHSPRKPRSLRPRSTDRRGESGFARKKWLIGAGAFAALALLVTALFAPNGLILAGSATIILGMAMVLVGFAAGAYGAFSEDFLYGFFYMVFAPYTGYYIVTRWDDLRGWFLCSTAGVVLVGIGAQMLRWGGVAD
jgi:predicted Zn finger-like uncharacterized protein